MILLLPKGKGKLWYWGTLNNSCIWYNSIRIIEQQKIDDWDNSIENLTKIIKEKTYG